MFQTYKKSALLASMALISISSSAIAATPLMAEGLDAAAELSIEGMLSDKREAEASAAKASIPPIKESAKKSDDAKKPSDAKQENLVIKKTPKLGYIEKDFSVKVTDLAQLRGNWKSDANYYPLYQKNVYADKMVLAKAGVISINGNNITLKPSDIAISYSGKIQGVSQGLVSVQLTNPVVKDYPMIASLTSDRKFLKLEFPEGIWQVFKK